MNRKTETAEFPYADRPMWLYSRSGDKNPAVLFRQMEFLREEAERQGYYVTGNSQDMSTGENPQRMGLQQMLKAVKSGSVRAVMLQNIFRLSRDTAVLVQILKFFQKYNTMLVVLNKES